MRWFKSVRAFHANIAIVNLVISMPLLMPPSWTDGRISSECRNDFFSEGVKSPRKLSKCKNQQVERIAVFWSILGWKTLNSVQASNIILPVQALNRKEKNFPMFN